MIDLEQEEFVGFRPVPRTGVIYVMTEAKKHGFSYSNQEWANLGQGAPETGAISGSPERILELKFSDDDLEYSPVDGLFELRAAVAELYNSRYRKGHSSKYTYENVSICSGGRLALTRLVSTLGRVNVGHFIPDYTAYEELLDAFGTFVPIPITLDRASNYKFSSEDYKKEIINRGLSATILSNPSNPIGKVIKGEELDQWVKISTELESALLIDEFYSHYLYDDKDLSVSAAQYVCDVNSDPVVILDGLTKNWRYPGFRVAWTVGPKKIIEKVASAGSFLDGGCPRPMQLAAVKLLEESIANQEAGAIKAEFQKKRNYLYEELSALGVKIPLKADGAFYFWGEISGFSEKISSGMDFFQQALRKKVIVVPGQFFDIDPGHRRAERASRFKNFVRFSFGPSMEELQRGVQGLKMLQKELS